MSSFSSVAVPVSVVDSGGIDIVCCHYKEDLAWITALDFERYNVRRIVVYECRVQEDNIPIGVQDHPRVVWRSKPPKADGSYAYYAYAAEFYDELPEHTLYMHGHNTDWHQSQTMAQILERIRQLRTHSMLPDYCTVSTIGTYDDWYLPYHTMRMNVEDSWPRLEPLLKRGPPPNGILDIACAQFVASRSRTRSVRTQKEWAALKQLAASVAVKSRFGFCLEGISHILWGEPDQRPFVKTHLVEIQQRRHDWTELDLVWSFRSDAVREAEEAMERLEITAAAADAKATADKSMEKKKKKKKKKAAAKTATTNDNNAKPKKGSSGTTTDWQSLIPHEYR